MRGHSRPKDGVLSHAYDPRIHDEHPMTTSDHGDDVFETPCHPLWFQTRGVFSCGRPLQSRARHVYVSGSGGRDMDEKTRIELEAAVYRRLVEHVRSRTDVQNIDMMNLAGFCRNCLSNWMKEA